MQYSTRANIIGLLALAKRPLKAVQLIRLAKCVGLSPGNVKSHLTRMVTQGTLHRNGTRRLATYWPSHEQMVVFKGIQARLSEKREQSWNGHWLILTPGLPA